MGKILVALLGGAAVGATLAVLFAPDKGSETRKKVNEYTGDLVNKITDMFGSSMGDATEGGSTASRAGQKRTTSSYSSQS